VGVRCKAGAARDEVFCDKDGARIPPFASERILEWQYMNVAVRANPLN